MTILRPLSTLKRIGLAILAFALGYWALIRFLSVPPPVASPLEAPLASIPIEAMGQGTFEPTPEEIVDEEHYFDEQVQKASIDLLSPSVEDRMNGIEQLAAYPTHDAELLLIKALTGDFDAKVRLSAAQSLASFKQPEDKTIDALLMMLEDSDKRVQLSSLDTLIGFMGQIDPQSARYKDIVLNLKKKTASKKLAVLTKKAMREYLDDL